MRVDEKLVEAKRVKARELEKLRLPWFAGQVDEGYFVRDAVRVSPSERNQYEDAANQLYTLFAEATGALLQGEFREEFGLSEALWQLAGYTWERRDEHPHPFGRFDLSGVIDGRAPKLIEFNADTATVLAEAALIQPIQAGRAELWNDIVPRLQARLAELAERRQDLDNLVVIATLGGGEDNDSAIVWQNAANLAHMDADIAELPNLTFSPGEGLFLERDGWFKYGILVKMLPWDWIDREEPELLNLLRRMIEGRELAVVNPPYTALMQSKAMLAELWRRHPGHPLLLPAGWSTPADVGSYVTKPLFGREGENVAVFEGDAKVAEAPGEFADQARIWQQFEPLPADEDGDVYQAGVYWAGTACGLAYRRRDGLIVDEDAEFVGHVLR